jgi:transcriptional regulator with XRE-family HTH domain
MNAFESEWYKTVKAAMTPGDALKIYRENNKLTQTALGKMLGGIPRQQVSNMENGIRPISIAMAKKLAAVFGVPNDRFIDLRTP